MPKFKSKNVQRKKPKVKKDKKPYTPFPPEPQERKIDKELAEGKYFVDQEERNAAKRKRPNEEKKKAVAEKQKEKRAKSFVPPEEPQHKADKPKQGSANVDIDALKKKVKKRKVTS